MKVTKEKKLKILIINPCKHNTIGGIETYTRYLIDIFSKNNCIVKECYILSESKRKIVCESLLGEKSFCLWNINHKKSFFLWSILNNCRAFLTPYKKINFFDLQNYDLIIHNHFYTSFNGDQCKLPNIIQVQHWSKKYYDWNIFSFKFLNFLIRKISRKTFCKYNLFEKIQNVVLFDEYNEKEMNLVNKNIYKIALPYKFIIKKTDEINFEKRRNILYIGRIEPMQKNIIFLNKAASHFCIPLLVYGEGWFSCFLSKKIKYMGIISHNKIKEVYSKAKVFVLVSNFEGFPFVLVEALSNGVPIIVRDTFPSAKFLVNNNKNGVLVNAKATPKEFAKIVNDFVAQDKEKLKQFSLNALNFANKHLHYDVFKKKWIQVLNDIINKNNSDTPIDKN